MNFPKPEDVLPHRDPFLFLTEITNLEPGKSATAIWDLDGNEQFFEGHFPGRPTLPGVLMCESIAQLGAYLVLSDDKFAGKLPLFGGLDKARFRRQVHPGETLQLRIEVNRLTSKGGRATGEARVDGDLACVADLMFVVVDR
ncbi:MAG: 3-hydroxyacyl-ACP dehydratase FabZ [Acidimicrobiales bacterium]|jgi:3-hydroxyacyl-[acyl-carrier-protein] dehydratase|nr:3-hydroxyacyl-ACP dehydratase FabZ [Acidimicrobiales bacterium]MDP6299325.1 3-hydroxyacyl-ACP dehydratase FabZ [Acidimicrobiales bacterium]HJM27871.1 3-hydroxyacyl-ACP dehydratase FabZ [Acidimicrobiales bacterium]HJM98430.1 3-hydroxyacyl-ACP dehydratase FabZ [Acidimicrobiales bacterium]